MAVQDDLRRLSQMDSIYFGSALSLELVTIWYKGRLQQANDGRWIFRSISSDGSVVGVQLGISDNTQAGNPATWTSSETPKDGLVVTMPMLIPSASGPPVSLGTAYLRQQPPQELID